MICAQKKVHPGRLHSAGTTTDDHHEHHLSMHDARSTHPDPKPFKPRQLTSIHQVNDIPIQALRVAGRIADQEVIFGNLDEQLTINYHCTDRNAFMQGILFACRQVKQLHQLHEGLTELLLPTIMKHARSMCS